MKTFEVTKSPNDEIEHSVRNWSNENESSDWMKRHLISSHQKHMWSNFAFAFRITFLGKHKLPWKIQPLHTRALFSPPLATKETFILFKPMNHERVYNVTIKLQNDTFSTKQNCRFLSNEKFFWRIFYDHDFTQRRCRTISNTLPSMNILWKLKRTTLYNRCWTGTNPLTMNSQYITKLSSLSSFDKLISLNMKLGTYWSITKRQGNILPVFPRFYENV